MDDFKYGAAGPNADPQLSALFAVEIDGIGSMAFESYKLGDSETNIMEARTGIDSAVKRAAAGLDNVRTITLEKSLRVGGNPDMKQLTDWRQGKSSDKRSGAIIVFDRDKTEVVRFNFKDAWISKWGGPDGDASSDSDSVKFTFELTVSEVTPEYA